jgi:hypothetical protein
VAHRHLQRVGDHIQGVPKAQPEVWPRRKAPYASSLDHSIITLSHRQIQLLVPADLPLGVSVTATC